MRAFNLSVGAFVICILLVSVIPVSNSVSYISQIAVAQSALTSPANSHNTTSPTNSSFLTYQNKGPLGIMINYPSNWKRMLADDKAVIFIPPSKKDKYSENLVVVLFDINSSISAAQLPAQAINNYGELYSDFFIIHLKPTTFLGDPAYVLMYTYTNPVAGKIIAMDIGIKHLDKVYVISYSAEQTEYDTYIFTVEKMIHSFHVT